jgi:hypothetical protein
MHHIVVTYYDALMGHGAKRKKETRGRRAIDVRANRRVCSCSVPPARPAERAGKKQDTWLL